MPAITDVITAIATGQFDDDLERIKQAVISRTKEQQRQSAASVAASITQGDRIRIKHDAPLRPRYLLGVPMVVEKVNTTTASVRVEDPSTLPSQRFAFGIRVPLAHCEAI